MSRTAPILGNTLQIQALRAEIERLAGFDAVGNPHVPTVLLQGETGTGKGLVARVMHESGPRAKAPFVDVNCAAIPEGMLEAELFGFEAGAFTDARRAKPGLFEAATGGTLFLDEIDSLSLPVQSKVLKAIEEKRVRRLGAVEAHGVDVKLVAASQKDLPVLVERGEFRADLYHRLAVLVFIVTPLRERREDILLLADHFLHEYAAAHGLADKHLTAGARQWLLSYPWPGNVRELSHVMERVTLLARESEVEAQTLESLATPHRRSAPVAAPPPAEPASEADDDGESIRAALRRTGGNVLRAAKLLGLGRNALRYRMRRLGIDRESMEGAPASTASSRVPPKPPSPALPVMRTPTWERKSVAVLSLAVTLSEATDSRGYEQWTAATRWDRVIADTVEGFGGVFVQRTPSHATAVFGVPRTVEQAPLRAVRAALAIQREAGQAAVPCPEIHASVHLGEVRVDTSSNDPAAQVLPIGDVFTLAERLLGHAGVGETLVSSAAARRVERDCELRPRPLQLGPRDQIEAHAVVAPSPKDLGPLRGDSAPTPFVGREREVGLVIDAFEQAVEGHGQVVFVAGDAGLGKSRLLAEFRSRLAGKPHRWVEGRCASYGATTSFLPINDGLRRYIGITDEDTEASLGVKINARLSLLGRDLEWTIPHVRQALSLEVGDEGVRGLDSASRRSEMFRALSTLMLRAAELEPQIIVVEDLHWIDPTSEEYLAFISDLIPAARVLIVLSHRPGYVHRLGDRSYHRRITLPPLSGADVAAVAGSIIGAADVPETLRALITRKAEGNPFFVEELVRSLLEQGALRRENGRVVLARDEAKITVPDTIQDVLLARIDRLAEDSRRAIQVASVIGREFALRLLARITEAGDRVRTQVDELRGLELIYEKTLHPELAYMFKHALTHDVAYGSVVEERRRGLHRTIGLAIEELYADRLPEHYETLAHHFSRAEDWEKAFLYHERSARKAAATYANHAVVEHTRRALAIADELGAAVSEEARGRLYEELGRAYFCLSEYAAAGSAYEEAVKRAVDGETRSSRLADAGLSYFWAHQYEPAKNCAGQLLELAERDGVASARARALTVVGVYDGVIEGNLESCERHIDQAWAITAASPDELVEAFIGQHAVFLAEWTGAYAKAAEIADKTIALGRKRQLPMAIVFPTWFLAKSRCCLGDYGAALSLLHEAYEFCDRIGDRAWRSRLLNTLGWCYAEIGDDERARGYNERAAAVARDLGDPEILSNASINLASNHLSLGRAEEALRHLEPVESAIAKTRDTWMLWRYSLHARHVRARYQMSRNEPDQALATATEQLEGARVHRAPKIEARALLQQASALLALERRDDADAASRLGLEISQRIGYRHGIWEAHFLLAEALRRAGDRATATSEHAKGWEIVDLCGRSLDEETRRHFMRRALHLDTRA